MEIEPYTRLQPDFGMSIPPPPLVENKQYSAPLSDYSTMRLGAPNIIQHHSISMGPKPTTGPPIAMGPKPTSGPPIAMGPKPTSGPPVQIIPETKSSQLNLGPPPNCRGEISDDGYEWVTWQEQWYWREPNTMLWNEFQN